jgi:hypothetical protein
MRACLILCVLGSLFLMTTALAEEPDPGAQRVLLPEKPVVAQPVLSPMMQEIDAVLAAEKEALEALNEQLGSAPDERAALHILQQIKQQKQDTELSILRIQRRYALEKGDTDAAERIDLAIDRILNPPRIQPDPAAAAKSRDRRAGGEDHD